MICFAFYAMLASLTMAEPENYITFGLYINDSMGFPLNAPGPQITLDSEGQTATFTEHGIIHSTIKESHYQSLVKFTLKLEKVGKPLLEQWKHDATWLYVPNDDYEVTHHGAIVVIMLKTAQETFYFFSPGIPTKGPMAKLIKRMEKMKKRFVRVQRIPEDFDDGDLFPLVLAMHFSYEELYGFRE